MPISLLFRHASFGSKGFKGAMLAMALAAFSLQAQTPPGGAPPSRILQPQSAEGANAGWKVDPKNGYLQFTLPVGTLGGDIPVPIVLRFNGTHVVREYYDQEVQPYGGWVNLDEPASASLSFGSVSCDQVFQGAYFWVPSTTMLEDGSTIRWNSRAGIPGNRFSLPQAFGLGAFGGDENHAGYAWNNNCPTCYVPPATISSNGEYAWYSTYRMEDLGALAAKIQFPDMPGVQPGAGFFNIVLSKDLARIYFYGLPVLWVDRFGHSVSFKWTSKSGVSGYDAVVSVKVLNDQGKGILAQWVSFSAQSATTEGDLLRLDWIGIQAPALAVKGLLVSGTRPLEIQTQIPYDSGIPGLGTYNTLMAGRPTRIRMGNPGSLPLPSWPLNEPVPDYPKESIWAPDLTWALSYDSATGSTVSSITGPLNTRTDFSYVPYSLGFDSGYVTDKFNYFMGVSQAVSTDLVTGTTLTETWQRTLPHLGYQGKWQCTYSKTFSDGVATGAINRKFEYSSAANPGGALPDDGVLVSEETLDSSGISYEKVTYGYQAGGLGHFDSLLNSITTVRSGEPMRVWRQTYDSNTWTPLVETTTVGGVKVEEISHSYETKWDLVIPGRETGRTVSRPGTLGGSLTSYQTVTLYDAVAWKPYLSYRLAGGLISGDYWTYDLSSGRLAGSTPYVPAAQGATSSQEFSYTPQGWLQRHTTTFTNGGGNATVATTWGSFTTQGQPLQQTDPNGITTSRVYDSLGRALTITRPGSPTLTTTYRSDGRRIDFQQSDGPAGWESRDGFGRMVSRLRLDGVTETYSYDSAGRVVGLVEDAGGSSRTSSSRFDPLGRLISQVQPGGISAQNTYSDAGTNSRTTTVTTNLVGALITAVQDRDPFGRVVLTIDPLGNSTATTYDLFGNPTQVATTDAASGQVQVRTNTYDGNGFLTSRSAPETGTTAFYDHTAKGQPGRIVEDRGPDGQPRTRTLSYDGLGRLCSASSGNSSVAYAYTGTLLTAASSSGPNGSVSQSYRYGNPGAALDLETTSDGSFNTQVSYTKDVEGHLLELGYPSGLKVAYAYANGKVNSVKVNGTVLATSSYDAWSRLNNLRFASGSVDHWDFNQVGGRLGRWLMLPGSGGGEQRDYSYDANLQLSAISQDWSSLHHNLLGQLLRAEGYWYTEYFAHDAFYNNTSSTAISAPPVLINFTLNSPLLNNRVPGLAQNGAVTGWDIPARGEAAVLSAGIGTNQFLGLVWDDLGRLAAVSAPGASQTYNYAPNGLRVSLLDSADSSRNRAYAYAGDGRLLSEFTRAGGTATWRRDIVYLGSRALAEVDAAGIHELHVDHLGSPRRVISSAGVVEGRQFFAPFGELLESTGYVPLTGFTGHLQQDATGLIYMKGRYYSPAWHRFVNSDQGADTEQSNQNAYCNGNPMQMTDPSGMLADGVQDGRQMIGDPTVDEALKKKKEQEEAAFKALLNSLPEAARRLATLGSDGTMTTSTAANRNGVVNIEVRFSVDQPSQSTETNLQPNEGIATILNVIQVGVDVGGAQPKGSGPLAIANAALTGAKLANHQITGKKAINELKTIGVLTGIGAINPMAGIVATYSLNVYNFVGNQIDVVSTVWAPQIEQLYMPN